jgi:hypothetical protein
MRDHTADECWPWNARIGPRERVAPLDWAVGVPVFVRSFDRRRQDVERC